MVGTTAVGDASCWEMKISVNTPDTRKLLEGRPPTKAADFSNLAPRGYQEPSSLVRCYEQRDPDKIHNWNIYSMTTERRVWQEHFIFIIIDIHIILEETCNYTGSNKYIYIYIYLFLKMKWKGGRQACLLYPQSSHNRVTLAVLMLAVLCIQIKQ